MKKHKLLVWTLGILVVSFLFWFLYLRLEQDNRLTKEGNLIVQKIEDYKSKNGYLPVSLVDIGIPVIDEANPPIYYEKRGKDGYIIWYSNGFDDNRTYYSDSKKWEYGYRSIK